MAPGPLKVLQGFLGIHMAGEKVIVAMSGGVDSSVAAVLLHEQGYRVLGVTLKLWDYARVGGNPDLDDTACCSVDSMADARAVCQRIGVPHFTLDFSDVFEKTVICDFVREYEGGRTPNPCVRCNSEIKWGALLQAADRAGAEFLATGHYARVIRRADGAVELRKGADERKDQSYALWAIRQEALKRTLFPLGDLRKEETRRFAAERGLRTATRPESQEICFIRDDDYGRFLEEWTDRGGSPCSGLVAGDIRDLSDGATVGTHTGIAHFTIGQRKGLGVAFGRPRYVARIDAETHTVWVGDSADLDARSVDAGSVNWSLGFAPERGTRCSAKIRYLHAGAEGKVEPRDPDGVSFAFDTPQRAVTPGQSLVIYDGNLLLGGGVITRATG